MKRGLKSGLLALSFSILFAASPLALASGGEEGHHGDQHGAASNQPETTASEAMKAIIKGNDTFKTHHDSHYFDAFQDSQSPVLTVVSCSDSRVQTHLFGIAPDNNLFMIRNIGNQIANAEGSVDYGVRHLPTKVLMILGHSSCGAVKAAMGDYSKETDAIKKELDPLKPVIAHDEGTGEFKERWAKNVERNVDYQVDSAMKLYNEKVAHGKLVIVGAVYDFNDIYHKGRGTLIITNINGERTPSKIMQHPVLHDLSQGELVTHVSSIVQ